MADEGAAASAEGAARSLALERAYVHDVYAHAHEGDREREHERHERAARFLRALDVGSLVCDVGCGSGKYLSVNPTVYSVGGDRCSRLLDQARQADSEVVTCDNLALPFRDECFDAVVSVAVVHHLATAERRARALRELARVLRIGGRVFVTVWAMEQRGRRFESQDVLIPWHRPQTLGSPSRGLLEQATARRREHWSRDARNALSTASDTDANRESHRSGRARGQSMDASRAALYSPGHSSLSSPNETCYSFVRRALQRLAGTRRAARPWFLHSWTSARLDRAAAELESDARDLPIELRRIDDDDMVPFQRSFPSAEESRVGTKSKSLSDILKIEQKTMVRSRSSVPSLGGLSTETPPADPVPEEEKKEEPPPPRTNKPKLVKQKKSINEEDAEEDLDKPTDMRSLVKELPSFKVSTHKLNGRKPGVFKQSSLNEELMSTERLREKERLRRNIQKQASLNEEYLYRRYRTLDSLRDSFFSTSANTAKKFQSLKNGLTNKLKTSTTNMEKVTVIGFVKMFQGWKSHEMPSAQGATASFGDPAASPAGSSEAKTNGEERPAGERRHSKEDGSDSSKDSSLQSDTSVDSEDSFASVIYVPKNDGSSQDPLSPTPLSPGPTSPRMKVSSVPTSPRMKSSPGLPSPRLKQVFPIIRTPSSPKATQAPVQINKILVAQFSLKNNVTSTVLKDPPYIIQTRSQPNSPPKSENEEPIINTHINQLKKTAYIEKKIDSELINTVIEEEPKSDEVTSEELLAEINKDMEEIHKLTAETEHIRPRVLQDVKPYPKITLQTVAELPEIPQFKSKDGTSPTNDNLDSRVLERKRRERLRQIRELLRQGIGTQNPRPIFPMVRRQVGKSDLVAKSHPKLMSLELFNPETDDMDSDSSGVSSPDSVDSVISVVPDEIKKTAAEKETPPPVIKHNKKESEPNSENKSPQSLLEAAAEVAQSLDETCEAVIQSSPRSKRKQLESADALAIVQGASSSSSGSNWSLNKLSPGDLRLLEERSRSHSHTSSSGSTSSLEKLSPGRRSKERSPKLGSTSNSTWSLNRLSPVKPDGKSFEENHSKCHKSPTRFPYDSISMSSTESDKSISKSDSFSRLQANEKLVTCKSDIIAKDEEPEDWNNECRQHLTEFAEKLSEKLLHEIDQYSKRINDEDFDLPSSSSSERSASLKLKQEEEAKTQKVLDDLSDSLQHLEDPYINKLTSDIQDLSKLTADIQERNKYIASLKDTQEPNDINRLFPKCATRTREKKSNGNGHLNHSKDIGVRKIIKVGDENLINNNTNLQYNVPNKIIINHGEEIKTEATEIISNEDDSLIRTLLAAEVNNGNPEITIDPNIYDAKCDLSQSLETGYSIESEISIDSFCTDKRSSLKVGQSTDSSEVEKMEISPESVTSRSSASTASTAPLKSGFSVESSDAGDMSGSGSDWSRRDTNSAGKTGSMASLGCASIASLPSCSEWSKERKLVEGRSSSEETAPVRGPLVRQVASIVEPVKAAEKRILEPSLSDTSQDSLPSENGGGAITYHRYYHVFKEGELDQLIEKYVENLHIISSFYDHSSWCVIAEKVQVWTI